MIGLKPTSVVLFLLLGRMSKHLDDRPGVYTRGIAVRRRDDVALRQDIGAREKVEAGVYWYLSKSTWSYPLEKNQLPGQLCSKQDSYRVGARSARYGWAIQRHPHWT